MKNKTTTCINCIFFEARTGFCRKNPPVPITVQDNNKTFITPAFPKIQMPNLDWCFEFVDKATKANDAKNID